MNISTYFKFAKNQKLRENFNTRIQAQTSIWDKSAQLKAYVSATEEIGTC